MCGIAGFYSADNIFSYDHLMAMTDALAHRGPDASGYFFEENAGLGHRRLSIIDLSEAANLPMFSQDKNFVIVFNGEIYNFQEIKKELLAEKAIEFKTVSDTEVVLEAFIHWGVDFVQKLNGMFAIALYDKVRKALYLFRDRIGIKPIYYFWDGKNFAFASELKGLTKVDVIRKNLKLNYTAVNEFLHLGYIPEPHSIYDKIYKFPAGSYAVLNNTHLKFTNYWDITSKIKKNSDISEEEAKIRLKELLISSVKYRMICDVPFGTFLSGGVDSSLITAIAQSLSHEPINTFSIGFKESKYNESAYAKAVSEFLGTRHHEFVVTEQDAMALIPELTDIYDEPYADSSAIPTMIVSALARKHVTMTLSGDGGDELFLGYGAYKWANRLNNPLLKVFHKPIHSCFSKLGNRYQRVGYLFDYTDFNKIKSHIFSQENLLFATQEVSALLHPELMREIELKDDFGRLPLTPAEAQSLFDLHYYLKDDLLVKVDRASMKYSLETRVPILDYRIVEFANNLSEHLKLKGNIQKSLLKEVLYEYIPAHFFNRPKWGFALPLRKWLKTDLKYLIDENLSEENIRRYNLMDYKQVEHLKYCFFEKDQDYLNTRLWELIVLHSFLGKK